jgi:SAM-dependent methyltransferase
VTTRASDRKMAPPDRVVESFGLEWRKFDQSESSETEQRQIFENYFSIFPWGILPPRAIGFDLGCGTGRWARFVAERVGSLACIDPSPLAIEVARRRLAAYPNCNVVQAGVENMPLPDGAADFGYSLGVLHHVADTQSGIGNCVRKLKTGAPFLIYLYYALDNRPWWFRAIWRASELVRRTISSLPFGLKSPVCDAIAALVYWPLARLGRLLEKTGMIVDRVPLSIYRDRSFYVMRNDALDRFGTPLERRFTRQEIASMLTAAGLRDIRFRESAPYWCAVGIKA